MDKAIKVLFGLIVLIALIWITFEFLPAGTTEFNYYFRHYTYNYLILKYIIEYLPYVGIVVSIVFLIKTQRKKFFLWLLVLSIFDALYIYRPNFVTYLNHSYNMNIAVNPQNGETPLYRFLEQNNTKNIIRLLENGANPNEKIKKHPSHIIQAIRKNNFVATEVLISKGADVNSKYGMSALHFAVKTNNLKLVKLLIDNGATIDTPSENIYGKYWHLDPRENYGRTALFIAVENNNSKIVKLLLDNGADAWIKDYGGKTIHSFASDKNISSMLNASKRY